MSSNEINKVSKSSEYLDQLKTFLKEYQIENFDYTQFIDVQPVYRSLSLSLYSAILDEQKYALKSLRNDWFFDREEFSQFKREKLSSKHIAFIINNITKSFDSEGVATSSPHSLFNANLNLNEHENNQMAATEGADDNSLIRQPIMNSGVKIYDYKEFTSIKKIGEGGYGQVERAHWESANITVALKSLKVKVNSNNDMIEELVREKISPVAL
ncbi:23988_t:CDS:2 [Cetraspora pellucida]|uniref:23988_t:CDS:1 n=1 Tax=Cetraspora pellucida TaxID=1433469 RepID=A0A9N9CS74_9GLOM|nr:23988_t:CDS:2 [Cetraspora pellucida]